MTIHELQKMQMNNRVAKFADKLPAAVKDSMPNFKKAAADFKLANLFVLKNLEIQQRDGTGYHVDKVNLREKLVEITLDSSAQYMAYAHHINNNVLYYWVKTTKRQLMNSSQEFCHMKSKGIYDLAIKEDPALHQFGLTPEVLSQYAILLAQYDLALPASKVDISIKKTATSSIKHHLKQTDTHLITLDGLISAIRSRQPKIHDDYFASRKLTLPTYNTLSARGTIKTTTGKPIACLITCETLNIKRRTTKKGTFKFSKVPNGPHTIKFERPGYEPVLLTINFITGIRAEIEVIMKELPPSQPIYSGKVR